MLPYDKQLKALSQHLRKNMTDAEKVLEMGIKVLTFSDRDVFENMGGVMERIWSCLWFIKSTLTPLCQRGVKKGGLCKRGGGKR